jgi:hypothetical protein
MSEKHTRGNTRPQERLISNEVAHYLSRIVIDSATLERASRLGVAAVTCRSIACARLGAPLALYTGLVNHRAVVLFLTAPSLLAKSSCTIELHFAHEQSSDQLWLKLSKSLSTPEYDNITGVVFTDTQV